MVDDHALGNAISVDFFFEPLKKRYQHFHIHFVHVGGGIVQNDGMPGDA